MSQSLEIESQPMITRAQESALYAFLRKQADGDALRYELIAKKIHRAASGYANAADESIVRDWLNAMVEEQEEKLARQRLSMPQSERKAFESLSSGKCGNPNYQAFLDTLEQTDLDSLTNNVPYFCFFSDREAEAKKLKRNDVVAYIREWADRHLSERVKALRH